MAVCKLKADSKSAEIARFPTDFMANVLLYDILNDEDLQKRRVRKKVNGIGRLARRVAEGGIRKIYESIWVVAQSCGRAARALREFVNYYDAINSFRVFADFNICAGVIPAAGFRFFFEV
jgi:hypothetical protein